MVSENLVKDVVSEPYKYGFVTDIETEKISKGLNEGTTVSYTHLTLPTICSV